jgi:hypothetical protein
MRQRPVAIIIFGILNLGFGLLSLAGPLVAIAVRKIKIPGQESLTALYSDPSYVAWTNFAAAVGVISGLALLAFGVGLLLSKNWARVGSIVYAVFDCPYVVVASVVTWRFMGSVTQHLANVPQGFAAAMGTVSLVGGLMIGLAYPVLLLFFMTRSNVIEACQPEQPPPPV